jgi:hypothetical protein
MKVTVDPEVCQGHARCWEICPEVFSLNPNLRLVPSVDLWFDLRVYAGLRVLVLAT